mgnify:CR=1 FL=1
MQQTKDLQKRKYLDGHKLNSAFFIDSENSIMFCRWCFILAIFIFAIEKKLRLEDFKNTFLRVRYRMSTELNSYYECFKYFKEYPGKWML